LQFIISSEIGVEGLACGWGHCSGGKADGKRVSEARGGARKRGGQRNKKVYANRKTILRGRLNAKKISMITLKKEKKGGCGGERRRVKVAENCLTEIKERGNWWKSMKSL